MIRHIAWGPETGIPRREALIADLRALRKNPGLDPAGLDSELSAFLSLPGEAGDLSSLVWPQGGRVVLATCDRVEIYQGSGPAAEETARHLFELASGLRSPLLGENAILGQIKRAYEDARAACADPAAGMVSRDCPDCRVRAGQGATNAGPAVSMPENHRKPGLSKGLHQLFQAALACGKKVRTLTGISRGAPGHAQAAMEVLAGSGGVEGKRILIVGVNKLNQDILAWLRGRGCGDICIINRDSEKAQALAAEFGCRTRSFDDLEAETPLCDILISATSAPHLVIHRGKHEVKADAILLDLAVPRDIDPEYARLDGVNLLDIQDIETRVSAALNQRLTHVAAARSIVDAELARYMAKTGYRIAGMMPAEVGI